MMILESLAQVYSFQNLEFVLIITGRRKKSSGLGRKKSDGGKGGKRPRRSANAFDECSLSDK